MGRSWFALALAVPPVVALLVCCTSTPATEAPAPAPAPSGCDVDGAIVPIGQPVPRYRCVGGPTSTCCYPCGCGKVDFPDGAVSAGVYCLGVPNRENAICGGEFDCVYGDAGYLAGDTFPPLDGCGICTCNPGPSLGTVSCKAAACGRDAGDVGTDAADASDAEPE